MTSPSETEQTFLIGQDISALYRDRYSYDRQAIIEEAVKAWRVNPLARRLANLFKIYNVDGISFRCEHKPTEKFLKDFWTHDLNKIKKQLEKISNEIFLTGNLFLLYSVDASGMTYVRVFPTDQIETILTADNDLQQETHYITRPVNTDMEPQIFKHPRGLPTATTPLFMRHETINQLAGTVWGEGEIWPDLPWLGRYANFLEDRVRLNRFRNAYIYIVSGNFATDDERRERERQINANPPRSGSVLVKNDSEKWAILAPTLDSFDASVDGQTIKKMIAVNHVPMHYLAEPESSTRTTADAAGTPTFKGFENQQEIFKDIILDMLKVAVQRKAEKDPNVKADAEITVTSADATERDNAALALATSQIVESIGDMYDRELLNETEYMRLVYRFAGETLPENFQAPKGKRKPITPPVSAPSATSTPPSNVPPAGKIEHDAETGETKVKEPQA